MPDPKSATVSSPVLPRRTTRTCTFPPLGVNLTALDSRFQSTCCSRDVSPYRRPGSGQDQSPSWMVILASAEGCTVSSAPLTMSRGSTRPSVEAELAGHDARHVEQLVDELRLVYARCCRSPRSRARPGSGRAPALQHVVPTRCRSAAYATRATRRQELILEPVGRFRRARAALFPAAPPRAEGAGASREPAENRW